MPRVPTVTQPSVAPKAFAPVFQSSRGATPEAFGGDGGLVDLGKQIQRSGSDVANAIKRIQDQDDDLDAKTRDIAFAQELQVLGFGDGTPNNPGFYSLNGKAAVDAAPQFRRDVEAAKRRNLEGATARVQRVASGSFDARILREFNKSSKFVLLHRGVAETALGEARQGQAITDAINNYTNQEIVMSSLSIVQSEAIKKAQRQGFGANSEEAQAIVRRDVTALVKGIFDAATAVKDTARQKSIINQFGPSVDGAVLSVMKKAFQKDNISKQSQIIVAEARALFGDDPQAIREHIRSVTEGGQESAAINEYNAQLGQERGDRTEQRTIKNEADRRADRIRQEQERVKKEKKESNQKFAIGQIRQGVLVDDLPANVFDQLTPSVIRVLRSEASRRAVGAPLKTDWKLYKSIMSMKTDDLVNVDLALTEFQLATQEQDKVVNRVTAALQGRTDPNAAGSDTQIWNAKRKEHGLIGTSDDAIKEQGQLQGVYLNRIAEEEDKIGRRLSTPARQTIADEVLVEVELNVQIRGPFGIFAPTRRAGGLTAEEQKRVVGEDGKTSEERIEERFELISEDDKAKAAGAFIKNKRVNPTGRQPTMEEIVGIVERVRGR